MATSNNAVLECQSWIIEILQVIYVFHHEIASIWYFIRLVALNCECFLDIIAFSCVVSSKQLKTIDWFTDILLIVSYHFAFFNRRQSICIQTAYFELHAFDIAWCTRVKSRKFAFKILNWVFAGNRHSCCSWTGYYLSINNTHCRWCYFIANWCSCWSYWNWFETDLKMDFKWEIVARSCCTKCSFWQFTYIINFFLRNWINRFYCLFKSSYAFKFTIVIEFLDLTYGYSYRLAFSI